MAVTYDGRLYSGVSPINTAQIGGEGQGRSVQADREDALHQGGRAYPLWQPGQGSGLCAYGSVEGVTLLTAHRDAEEPGTLVPAKGLEMLVVSPRPVVRNSSGTEAK